MEAKSSVYLYSSILQVKDIIYEPGNSVKDIYMMGVQMNSTVDSG